MAAGTKSACPRTPRRTRCNIGRWRAHGSAEWRHRAETSATNERYLGFTVATGAATMSTSARHAVAATFTARVLWRPAGPDRRRERRAIEQLGRLQCDDARHLAHARCAEPGGTAFLDRPIDLTYNFQIRSTSTSAPIQRAAPGSLSSWPTAPKARTRWGAAASIRRRRHHERSRDRLRHIPEPRERRHGR